MSGSDFVVIDDWMVDDLNLKGTALITYAVIYGFTKEGMGLFTGSVSYLMRWTGMSRKTTYRTLSELIDEGLVKKAPYFELGVAKTYYRAVFPECQNDTNQCQNDTPECQNDTAECQNDTQSGQNDTDECQNDTPIYSNNIPNNIPYNLPNKYIVEIEEIVAYLNATLGTRYQPKTESTAKLIRSRLKEGFTVDDFKTVIDKKAAEWRDDPKMSQYLRPSTLFGSKFEAYLNQISATRKSIREVADDLYSEYNRS